MAPICNNSDKLISKYIEDQESNMRSYIAQNLVIEQLYLNTTHAFKAKACQKGSPTIRPIGPSQSSNPEVWIHNLFFKRESTF
jgi:hypothetical protein